MPLKLGKKAASFLSPSTHSSLFGLLLSSGEEQICHPPLLILPFEKRELLDRLKEKEGGREWNIERASPREKKSGGGASKQTFCA